MSQIICDHKILWVSRHPVSIKLQLSNSLCPPEVLLAQSLNVRLANSWETTKHFNVAAVPLQILGNQYFTFANTGKYVFHHFFHPPNWLLSITRLLRHKSCKWCCHSCKVNEVTYNHQPNIVKRYENSWILSANKNSEDNEDHTTDNRNSSLESIWL